KESVLFFTMTETVADGFTSPVELIRAPVAYTGIERALPADQFSSFLSTRQKELYEAALAVHNVAIENYRPVTKRKSRGR
ncbi:MAG: hypothetical protein ABI672_17270, partial [Vicinamibacteria bacterium]